MAVLDCFAGGRQLSLTAVATCTGLPKSTTFRIMQALVQGGYLEKGVDDSYRAGRRVADLVPRRRVAEEAAPHLYVLSAKIGIVVSFGAVDDGQVATLISARPPVRYCAAQVPAERDPMHASAMGKALLAFHPEGPAAAVRKLGFMPAYTARTHTSAADLTADLERSRRSGFTLSDEERSVGVRGVAVPVFGLDGAPVGAIGVQAGTKRMTDALVVSLVPALRHFAGAIGKRLRDDSLIHA